MSALIRINYQSIRDKEQQNYSKIILKIGEEVNGNEVMIGRDNDCNISINSIEISRKHAIIKYVKSDKNWIITDLQVI
jgi:pSer/pThr/pTyr-binding forkhead associated (FHA) protein